MPRPEAPRPRTARTGPRARSRPSARTRRILAAVVASGAALTVLGSANAAADAASANTASTASTVSTAVDRSEDSGGDGAYGRSGGSDRSDAAKVTCHSRDGRLAGRLSHDIAGALHGRQGTEAVALYDRHTGTSCDLRGHAKFDSASVVKVTVLGSLLRKAEDSHRKLTAHEKKAATAMITKSDNEATTDLWHRVGVDHVKHFLKLAGMRETTPGRGGTWGLTQITAADQAKLLKLLTAHNTVLHDKSRSYALTLLNKVERDQRWGTPAGAPDEAVTHVKNGWLERSSHGWRVHSVGAFTGHRADGGGAADYGIVVLTHGNKTMGHGVDSIERAARAVHRDLADAR